MASITVRDIPDEVLEKLRALSAVERRSLNSEILLILEQGAYSEFEERLRRRRHLSKSAQVAIWRQLLGAWEDERTAKEIIEDIYARRTGGRDVQL